MKRRERKVEKKWSAVTTDLHVTAQQGSPWGASLHHPPSPDLPLFFSLSFALPWNPLPNSRLHFYIWDSDTLWHIPFPRPAILLCKQPEQSRFRHLQQNTLKGVKWTKQKSSKCAKFSSGQAVGGSLLLQWCSFIDDRWQTPDWWTTPVDEGGIQT